MLVNLRTVVDVRKWINNENNIYIGRKKDIYIRGKKYTLEGSKWANPHRITNPNRRENVVKRYEQYIRNNSTLLRDLRQLKGKNLGCWCYPKLCHGNIILNILEEQQQGIVQTISFLSTKRLHKMDPQVLEKQVTDALQGMSDILENSGQDIRDLQFTNASIFPMIKEVSESLNNVAVPPVDESTVKINEVYETLLESKSSTNNSCNNESSSSYKSTETPSPLTNKEKFEIDCKLNYWRSKQSKSHEFCSISPLQRTKTELKSHSVPTTPSKYPRARLFSSNSAGEAPIVYSSSSLVSPLAQLSSSSGNLEQNPVTDTTAKILEFLATKVDLLSVSVNTIQFNLTKIFETLHSARDVKDQKSVADVNQEIEDKFIDLENKMDNYKSMLEKDLQAVKAENHELKDKLESYILQEAERYELIKECFNNPENPTRPCVTDLLPLREELEKKLYELDVRLIECEQYSRRESLVISGIPDTIDQKHLQSKVIQILSTIDLHIVPDDISACHRLYNPPNSQFPARVVVRFVNRKIVNFCLDHRNDLQQQARLHLRLNLRFFESLCAKNEESLRICKWLNQEQKIHDHFLRNGFVKVVMEENGRPQKVKHPEFLRRKFEHIPEGI